MTEQAPQPHTLRVKIGTSEFEASGTEESVREQYDLFLKAVASAAPPSRQPPAAPPGGGGVIPPADNSVAPDLVQRAFTVRGDSVSLNALPRGENAHANALLMLLWGFEQLKNVTAVGAGTLIEAARTSGITLARIDRVLDRMGSLVLSAGIKRGTRYSLTNPGRVQAAMLIHELYQ